MNSTPHKGNLLTHHFDEYVQSSQELSEKEKEYILSLFEQPHIKRAVLMSMILVVWALVYVSVDGVFLGYAIVNTALEGLSYAHYLPWILITIVNFVSKYLFLEWFDSDNYFSRFQYVLGALPTIGVLFFSAVVFKKEKLFLKTLRRYLRHLRKRGARYILGLLHKIPLGK